MEPQGCDQTIFDLRRLASRPLLTDEMLTYSLGLKINIILKSITLILSHILTNSRKLSSFRHKDNCVSSNYEAYLNVESRLMPLASV